MASKRLAQGDYEVVLVRGGVRRWAALEASRPDGTAELLSYLAWTPFAPHRQRRRLFVSSRRRYQGEEQDQVAFLVGGTTVYFIVVERRKRVVITDIQIWAVGGDG